jgi:alpha-L-fucosidase
MMHVFLNRYFLLVCALLFYSNAHAQQATSEPSKQPELDQAVQQKLDTWQDLKFGLLMHWGTYSQWGIVESWSICPEDEGWTQRKGPYSQSYNEYKQAYENLQTTFNPIHFSPDQWVQAAKYAGMKYMIFTTKHHDGFAMFDTHQSDYKITDTKTPFSSNPKANITQEIFNSFRKEHFIIGAYFSKPDWHTPYYWWPYFPPKDRHVNYDPKKYPERWQQYKDYTYHQIQELMTEYGSVDILWLDGGWVRPNTADDSIKGWQNTVRYNEDIDMAHIAQMARKNQPGLIIVDRAVPGEFENYTTPEQQVPEAPLNYRWETCMTMGDSWSYVPGDRYKSVTQIVQLLVKVVSRGGNLLLNIGPGPDGDWDPKAYDRLKGIGDWMQRNSEGIYNSRAVAPYSSGSIYYTKSKDQNRIYAYYLSDHEDIKLPNTISIPLTNIHTVKKVSLLGTQSPIKWIQNSNGIEITQADQIELQEQKHAICFAIDYE